MPEQPSCSPDSGVARQRRHETSARYTAMTETSADSASENRGAAWVSSSWSRSCSGRPSASLPGGRGAHAPSHGGDGWRSILSLVRSCWCRSRGGSSPPPGGQQKRLPLRTAVGHDRCQTDRTDQPWQVAPRDEGAVGSIPSGVTREPRPALGTLPTDPRRDRGLTLTGSPQSPVSRRSGSRPDPRGRGSVRSSQRRSSDRAAAG